jgi:hypothetical protein
MPGLWGRVVCKCDVALHMRSGDGREAMALFRLGTSY